eukprot:7390694-Prymnesium_polylepis.1
MSFGVSSTVLTPCRVNMALGASKSWSVCMKPTTSPREKVRMARSTARARSACGGERKRTRCTLKKESPAARLG